jgi:hypothetical protein
MLSIITNGTDYIFTRLSFALKNLYGADVL